MKAWKDFSEKHPKAAKWIYQLFYFWVFSMGVTIFQYLAFTFLPYILGNKLAGTEFMWPQIPIHFAGLDYKWNILGYEVAKNATGEVVIGGGLGYFISYEVGSFLAQCINFPLQRNITFKSQGNIRFQMSGYFVAWILISLFCNGINGLWLPIAQVHFSPAIYNLLVTFITGGVSMVIYFFAFKIIFPGESAKK
ncbi:MAG: putative rane spanning protein [Lachnospiraceae bacterium]|nr:putative rane spanning protein [Lachnospiraceae bacterium]MDF2844664.1 putative rane spanning protein [Herbinix sp.]